MSGKSVRGKKATKAMYEYKDPVYLRLGTNGESEIYENDCDFELGKGIILRNGHDITLISTGSILKDVLDVADELKLEGINARVINMHTIKPIDEEIIKKAVNETEGIITIEDHNVIGGLRSAVAEVIVEEKVAIKFKRVGLMDSFSKGYGNYIQLKENNGLGK